MFSSSSYYRNRKKDKKHKTLFRVLLILALFAYLALMPRPVREVPAFRQMWATDIGGGAEAGMEEAEKSLSSAAETIPFAGETHFGYLSESGSLLLQKKIRYRIAMGEDSYINYSRMGDSLSAEMPKAGLVYRIHAEGYPVYRNGGLFVLSHDSMSIIAAGKDGQQKYRLDFSTMITDFDAGSGLVAAGLLNGKAEVFSAENGEHITALEPQEDNRPVYGLAISPDGTYVSLLWGDGPQHMSLYRREKQSFREVQRFSGEEAIRWEGFVSFSEDETMLFYETPSGCSIVDLSNMEAHGVSISGTLYDVMAKGKGHPIYLVENTREGGRLHVLTEDGERIAGGKFSDEVTFLVREKEGVVCTSGGKVVYINGRWM